MTHKLDLIALSRSQFGRYFVNSYEVKVFSSILGLAEAAVYFGRAALLYNDARSLAQ